MVQIKKLIHLKFHKILQFLEICNTLTCTWPYNPDNSKFMLMFQKFICGFTVLNGIFVEITLMRAIYEYGHDVTIIMKSLTEFICVADFLIKLILCRLNSARIQHILKEMKNFLLASNDRERIILQKYIDRYACFSMFVTSTYFLAPITFLCTPMFTSRKFPTEGLYPFSTESSFVTFVIFATQIYTSMQVACSVSVDFMFTVFFLYTTARLEMLCLEIQTAKSERQINSCIKKHQEIIKRQSLGIASSFIFLVASGCERVYVTAWAADDLMENSERVAMAVYNMSWIGRSQRITKNIYFMMQRSQKPFVINMGLLPILSLKHFAKYLVTLLSYFTTMRAIIGDLNN
ncbi:odorant receptor Or2 [Solenopsis invicta]|uniref:odorant receptor Or2 n=1 Tax=Solenopsis invicta TaxID=13686 RepID=UPI00193CC78B|nr:odorant receptor Or2 [Solenopsis invicta]